MKKIYITGIAGLLGINIAYILRNKFEVVGVDLISMNMPGITTETLDLLDEKELENHLIGHSVDILIHTAAAVDVDMCENNPRFAKILNVRLTQVLAEICSINKIKMIYISTDAVFDGKSQKLYKEEDMVKPLNVYAKTKLEGEQYVLMDPKNTVIRTNIYGYNGQNKKSFGEWILSSLLNGETINMFEDIYFSPILVNELADIIEQVIERNLTNLYHVCGTGSISKYEFALALKRIFKIKNGHILKTKSDDFDFKAKRSKNMGMSNKKIRNELNINIRTPIESIEYFKKLYDEGYHQVLKEMEVEKNGN